jgi:hypothetical protein
LFFNDLKFFDKRAEFGHLIALPGCVKQLNKTGDTTMVMEKKSIVSKKTAPASKGNSKKSKIDTSKPAASKVVAARGGVGHGR